MLAFANMLADMSDNGLGKDDADTDVIELPNPNATVFIMTKILEFIEHHEELGTFEVDAPRAQPEAKPTATDTMLEKVAAILGPPHSAIEDDAKENVPAGPVSIPYEMTVWDANFFADLAPKQLIEIVVAADHVDCQMLVRAACVCIGDHVMAKDHDQICDFFQVEPTFTTAEREQLRQELLTFE